MAKWLIATVLLCLTLSSTLIVSEGRVERSVEQLEALLDGALPSDKPIKLVEGESFLSKHGTVIFASRGEGRRRMIKLASERDFELAMLFLPEWSAWVTITIDQGEKFTASDYRYTQAACASGLEVEIGHTHTDIKWSKEISDEEHRGDLRQWTMPSDTDAGQLYSISKDCSADKLRGFVSSIYGTTEYWSNTLDWNTPRYVHYAIQQEAIKLNHRARELSSVIGLRKFAREHRDGYLRIRFLSRLGW